MSLVSNLSKQGKAAAPMLVPSYILILLGLFLVAAISITQNIPVAMFTRDPTIALGGGPFTGVISNIGILFWCAAAALCFFCGFCLLQARDSARAQFLFASGSLTLLLLLDDLFMLHENVLPIYFRIPENAVYLGYILAGFGYLIWYRKLIFTTDFGVLFLGGGFLALSLLSDVFLPQTGMEFLFEDGLKLIGIVTWFIYFARTCYIFFKPLLARSEGSTIHS